MELARLVLDKFTPELLAQFITALPATLAAIGALIVSLRGTKEVKHMKNALIASADAVTGDRATAAKKMRRRKGDTHTNDQEFLQRKERTP